MTKRQIIFKGNTIGYGEDIFHAKRNARNKTKQLNEYFFYGKVQMKGKKEENQF